MTNISNCVQKRRFLLQPPPKKWALSVLVSPDGAKGAEPRRATLERVTSYFDVPVTFFQMKAAPHSEIFRRNVDDSLSNADADDLATWAANNSGDYNKITKMLEESYPITLEEAFEVAEILREPIYDLIGEGTQEEDEQTKNAPIDGAGLV